MAVAAVAAGGVAEAGARGVGQGQGATGEATQRNPSVTHEGQGEDASAVVRQRSGTDDGGDPWSGGVSDGFAGDGRGTGNSRIPTQEADRTDVCPCSQGRDGERVSAVSQGEQAGGKVR